MKTLSFSYGVIIWLDNNIDVFICSYDNNHIYVIICLNDNILFKMWCFHKLDDNMDFTIRLIDTFYFSFCNII
jgi:hypothetical protein